MSTSQAKVFEVKKFDQAVIEKAGVSNSRQLLKEQELLEMHIEYQNFLHEKEKKDKKKAPSSSSKQLVNNLSCITDFTKILYHLTHLKPKNGEVEQDPLKQPLFTF